MPRYDIGRIARYACPVFRKNHLFAANLQNAASALRQSDRTYEIQFPCDGDAYECDLQMLGLSPEAYRMRKDAGDLLGVIRRGPHLVHRSLVQVKGRVRVAGDRSAFILKQHRAYIHYCETLDAERGRGLYPLMLMEIQHRLTGFGTKEVFISCEQKNCASVRGILKAGFHYKKSCVSVSMLWGILHHSFWYQDRKGKAMSMGSGQ